MQAERGPVTMAGKFESDQCCVERCAWRRFHDNKQCLNQVVLLHNNIANECSIPFFSRSGAVVNAACRPASESVIWIAEATHKVRIFTL